MTSHSPPATPRLRFVNPSREATPDRSLPCGKLRLILGRGVSADVVLPDDGASRAHASIVWSGQTWLIEDLGSRNGTRVNGEPLQAHRALSDGDRIRIGTTELVFELPRSEAGDPPALLGEHVADCTLLEPLGTGTVGDTWRAEDATGEPKAIKLLHEHALGEPTSVAQFIAGTRAQMRLVHPHVLTILTVATTPRPLVVMEYASGGSLANRLANSGSLTTEQTLRMATQVVSALAAGQSQQIIHAALHPGNILFDGEGSVLLADFAQLGSEVALARRPAHASWVAPEEVDGRALDQASVQCRLGLILWQCLTGTVPYAGSDPMAVARARLTGSLSGLDRRATDIPKSLPRLLARMLCREPRHRFASWTEVAEGLEAVARGSDVPTVTQASLLNLNDASEVTRVSSRRSKAVSLPARVAPSPQATRPTERIPAGPSARLRQTSGRRAVRPLGLPASTWAGIGILVLLVAIVLTRHHHHPAIPIPVAPAATSSPMPASSPSPAAAVATQTAAQEHSAATAAAAASPVMDPAAQARVATATTPAISASPPPLSITMPVLHPQVLLASRIGGAQDQAITAVTFDAQGRLTATGTGFTALIDTATGTAAIHGDIAQPGVLPAPTVPSPLSTITTVCGATTITGGTHHEGGLSLPQLSGGSWSWWQLDATRAASLGLACDTLLSAVFPVPGRRVLVVGWAEGANTCLARDPRDVTRPLRNGPHLVDGAATWAILGDEQGLPERAVALPTAFAATVDPWGRLYLASASVGRDHLGMAGLAGVTVLSPGLSEVVFDAHLGGRVDGEPGWEAFTAIAYHDGLLALGGSTSAQSLATCKPMQRQPGGGQDGLVVVLRLWDNDGP